MTHPLLRQLKTLSAVALLALSSGAHAQQAPASMSDGPIRILVPFSPGGAFDSLARALSEGLRNDLKRTIVIDNKTGAGGAIAAQQVAHGPADGHTLLLNSVNHFVNVALIKDLGYEPYKDFVPISDVVSDSLLAFVVSSTAQFNDLPSVIAYGKANPGKLTWGFGGHGSPAELTGTAIFRNQGLTTTPVPYRGGPELVTAVIGGQVNMVIMTLQSAIPLIKQGRVKAVAISGAHRVSALPNVPTVSETLPDFPLPLTSVFLLAPAGTPPEIVTWLQTAVNHAVKSPAYQTKIEQDGSEVRAYASPAEFRQAYERNGRAWEKLARDIDLRAE